MRVRKISGTYLVFWFLAVEKNPDLYPLFSYMKNRRLIFAKSLSCVILFGQIEFMFLPIMDAYLMSLAHILADRILDFVNYR